MGQAILKVDFVNKKRITEQQNNSDFYKNKHELCDGEVTIFTTTNSGGNWQMRMRVQGHRQYHQKSLRTKNFETARKKSIQTNTHKLINKAKANIKAVEKGAFGVGH